MRSVIQDSHQWTSRKIARSGFRTFAWLFVPLLLGAVSLHGQCPSSGQTKVTKPAQGNGFYFFRFIGVSSFYYFLDGQKFSFNDKDDPGKTFIFIDDFAYESLLVDRAEVAKYAQGSKPIDLLRAQAKHQQDYFKQIVPSTRITDYGPSGGKSSDGSDDRLFYLWKKESPSGSEAATQYLVSTLIKDGVVVLSLMPTKGAASDDEVFPKIQTYTSHFNLMSSALCAKVLSAPPSP